MLPGGVFIGMVSCPGPWALSTPALVLCLCFLCCLTIDTSGRGNTDWAFLGIVLESLVRPEVPWGWAMTWEVMAVQPSWASCFAGSRVFPALLGNSTESPQWYRLLFRVSWASGTAHGWLPLHCGLGEHSSVQDVGVHVVVWCGKMVFIAFCLLRECDELDL